MTKKMQEFLVYVSNDEELAKKVNGLREQYKEKDAVVKATIEIAKEHGFVLTAEDFEDDVPDGSRALSDEELENVAGGASCGCVVGGGGAATGDKEETCACALGGGGMIWTNHYGKDYYNFRCVCAWAGGGVDKAISD